MLTTMPAGFFTPWVARALDDMPGDVHIDGIDQSSFLIADDGQGLREQIQHRFGSTFAAIRMRECKSHVKVILPQRRTLWIDMATAQDVGVAPWAFNLFIAPKEQYPVGHRMNAWLASLGADMKAHAATFRKHPPKDIGH